MVEKPDKNFIPNMNIIARHEAISFKLIKIALCKNLRNDPILFFGSFFSTKKRTYLTNISSQKNTVLTP